MTNEDKYKTITIDTSGGMVESRFYPGQGALAGVIMVGGVGGGFDTPANDLYPKLCEKLQINNIASLRIKFRHPTDLIETVLDVLAGINFLESNGIRKHGLIGHSLGGAVVIQAAAKSTSVKTVVTLATQSYGASAVRLLPVDCSILLIHGADDNVLPAYCSEQVYKSAHEPKKLLIFQDNGHDLDKSADEIMNITYDWFISNLK